MPAPTHTLPDLIALTGAAGAGKDTAAAHLTARYGYGRLSFAAPMRSMVQALLDHLGSHLALEGSLATADKEAAIAPLRGLLTLGGEAITPRLLMQSLGTEWGRDRIHPMLWVAVADVALHMGQQRGLQRVVVTDLRMPEEWAWVRRKGGAIWRIERAGATPVRPHLTETALTQHPDQHRPDVLLPNNGTVARLYAHIDELMLTNPRGHAR